LLNEIKIQITEVKIETKNYPCECIHSETSNSSHQSIAWQAAFQGVDPWGVDAAREGEALTKNDFLPLSAQLNYTLDVSYLWSDGNNSRPHNTTDNLKASILVDLWFVENHNDTHQYSSSLNDPKQQPNRVLVIDLAFANLENVNGRWRQDPYLWEGVQYYRPFAQEIGEGQLVYYYNIVGDTDGEKPWMWYHISPTEYPKTLDEIISDAFKYDYAFNDGTHAPSLDIQDFNLVNIEAGVEVWNDIGASGELTASFSLCNLTYSI
jgi:hypothetical protein